MEKGEVEKIFVSVFSVAIIGLMIYVLAFHGLSLTGFATYGANAFCGAHVTEDSQLTGTQDCSLGTVVGGDINNSGVVLNCQFNTLTGDAGGTPGSFGIKTNSSAND